MNSRIEYELTAADHVAKLERFIQGSSVGRGFTWFAYFAIVGLAWLSAILFFVKQGSQNYGYLFSGAAALFLTVSLPSLYRWYQNAFWSSVLTPAAAKGLVGRKTLEMSDDHVEEAGEVLTVRARWRDIQRVDKDPQRIFLVLAPLLAIVIPNHAFDTDDARDLFVRGCEVRIAEQSVGCGVADGALPRDR